MTRAEPKRRQLPAVGSFLDSEAGQALIADFGRAIVIDELRRLLEALRAADRTPTDLRAELAGRLAVLRQPPLRRVINATGVLLHTNLGRAPLEEAALLDAVPALSGGADLEWETGRRARRGGRTPELLARLYGGEAAAVVGNNAAAVLLALAAIGGSGEVVVSRGELVAIGGGFRIPEILAMARCRLREVGTTNRTTLDDIAAAIGPRTRAILRASASNFRQVGFVARPDDAALAELVHRQQLPLLVDLGSGAPASLAAYGLIGVETVPEVLAAGADLVMVSGDKLLGGPQSGILVGRETLVRKVLRHPLYRAVRPGRFTYHLLGRTAEAHLLGQAERRLPLYQMLAASLPRLERRAEAILRQLPSARPLRISRQPSQAAVGGGTTPGLEIASRALVVAGPSLRRFAARLLDRPVPIASRLEADQVWIDLRSVLPEDDAELARGLGEALGRG